ncbi:DNA topoisomerase 4 subunit A [Bosea thiooxidans]
MTFVPGPDFPTGGIIVESRESMAETYRTGRGAFRTRARWHVEDQGHGTWLADRHRDPLHGLEGAADREDRRAAQR